MVRKERRGAEKAHGDADGLAEGTGGSGWLVTSFIARSGNFRRRANYCRALGKSKSGKSDTAL